MSPRFTLYGCPNTRSLRAAWALEEAGAKYDYVRINLFKGEGRQPPLIDLNPGGKVPTLRDGELTLTESAAIITHLGECFPKSGLMPGRQHRAERAAYFEWSFFVMSELEQPLWTIAKHRFALPEKLRRGDIEPTAAWEFQRAMRRLAGHLEGRDTLLESGFCGADILVAHTLAWARSARIDGGQPALDAYLERHWHRPAAERARARESKEA